MLKVCLIFILMVGCSYLNAQSVIQGKVVDSKQNPLEAVYVYWDLNHAGVVTNSEGEFQIEISDEIKFITVEQFEYEIKKVAVSELRQNPLIQLEDFVVQLEEALILNKKSDEVLADVISSSKQKLNKSLLVNTFYREFIAINNEFSHYSDGLLDFYIKRNSGKSDLYVKQSRNFQLFTEEESEKNLSLSVSSPFDIRDALGDAFQFGHLESILNDKKLYTFRIKEFTGSDGNKLRRIEISPNENAKELLFEGEVIYDVTSNLILDYKLNVAAETIPFSKMHNLLIAKAKIKDVDLRFNYRLDGEKYRLVFRRVYFETYIKFGKKVDDDFQFTSDFVVLDYKENELPPTGIEKYKKRNLFEAGTNFTDEYWKSILAITPTQKEQDLIDSLQKN